MNSKVAAGIALATLLACLSWRQMHGNFLRWDVAPGDDKPTIETVPEAALVVTTDGQYLLDEKRVAEADLNSAILSLRKAQPQIRIHVVAKPGAPLTAVATALRVLKDIAPNSLD